MEAEVMRTMVEGNCPFASRSHMKVREVGDDGKVSMVLEDDAANYNAFGLIHAGAICGLAETVGGMALFRYLDPAEVVVLNTVLNIRFVAMPRGELGCEAVVLQVEVDRLLDRFRESGKADKAMDLEIRDSSRKVVAKAQATFRFMPTPHEFKSYFSKLG